VKTPRAVKANGALKRAKTSTRAAAAKRAKAG
jgi:hypothetical protein